MRLNMRQLAIGLTLALTLAPAKAGVVDLSHQQQPKTCDELVNSRDKTYAALQAEIAKGPQTKENMAEGGARFKILLKMQALLHASYAQHCPWPTEQVLANADSMWRGMQQDYHWSINASDAPTTTLPQGLGVYSNLNTYCGTGVIPVNPAEIPRFGCFYVLPGHSTAASFDGSRAAISVNAKGEETFTGDGKEQVPGYLVGHGHIAVLSRNEDKSVLFIVDQCAPPHYYQCASTKEIVDNIMTWNEKIR
jgi:hypothetical protein